MEKLHHRDVVFAGDNYCADNVGENACSCAEYKQCPDKPYYCRVDVEVICNTCANAADHFV